MRKILSFLLCLLLLVPMGASAAEEKRYVALTIEGELTPLAVRELLAGLDRRGIRATFFLTGADLAQNPDLGAQLGERGHEVGIRTDCRRGGALLSRREIAGEIALVRNRLPGNCPVRFLRPREGCTDALEQVAGALDLAIGDWSLDPAAAGRDASALGGGFLSRVRDGDVLRVSIRPGNCQWALNMAELLKKEGFTPVTLSELARLRGIRLHPGRHYRFFPPQTD